VFTAYPLFGTILSSFLLAIDVNEDDFLTFEWLVLLALYFLRLSVGYSMLNVLNAGRELI